MFGGGAVSTKQILTFTAILRDYYFDNYYAHLAGGKEKVRDIFHLLPFSASITMVIDLMRLFTSVRRFATKRNVNQDLYT